MTHTLTVKDGGALRRAEAMHDETIHAALARAGFNFSAPCGGRGTCKKCAIIDESTGESMLACQTRVKRDMSIALISRESAILASGVSAPVERDNERGLGVAVDMGTTTMAAYLVDLYTGDTLALATMLNPQRAHGADVVSRCAYAMQSSENADMLYKEALDALSALTQTLTARAGRAESDIIRRVCVGNTVMMHLLARLNVGGIAVAPFTPEYTQAHSRDLGGVNWYLGGCVSGYVGADTVAAMLACDLDRRVENAILIDIGTNGEIVAMRDGNIVCCACAAGPAFEGAHIVCGMGAHNGAIDHARFEDGKWTYTTIGGGEPEGFCGSGLIDVMAQLLRAGRISPMGRMEADEYVSARAYITQRDVREVQLAKAAIAAGIQILLTELDMSVDAVERVYLAGGFGNYVSVESACGIGMLPPELGARVVPVGNAAGEGAKRMLVSAECRARAEALRRRMRYVELSARADFSDEFTEQLIFGSDDET